MTEPAPPPTEPAPWPPDRHERPPSRRGPRSWWRRSWGRSSLRLRVTLSMVVLVAIALGFTSTFGTRLVRDQLVDQLDDRLVQASDRFFRGPAPFTDLTPAPDRTQVSPGPTSEQPEVRRIPNATFFMLLDAKGRQVDQFGGGLGGDVSQPDLVGTTPAEARRRGPRPFTVGSTDGSERWRASVQVVTIDGDDYVTVVATGLGDTDALVARLQHVQWLMGLGVIGLLAVVGAAMVRVSLKPLTDIERTAAAIGAGDLSQRVPDADPRTEVGHLAGALNGMLAQIEGAVRDREASEQEARQSEERMRRFVADASHELRTPLTSIRGFAELHRRRAGADGRTGGAGGAIEPAEVDRSMQRIETEAERMGGLVEDLLLLARLDEDRPTRRDPVDLVPLVADAAYDVHTLAPDRPVDVDLPDGDGGGAGSGVVVAGDEARLRQVLANLVSNALVHTPDGTAVHVRLRTDLDAREAVVEVADDGPGLAPGDADRAFERFYRADKARARATGGSGLGLSIVASIAAAHGGSVALSTAPGSGATFTIRLPLLEGATA